MYQVHYTLDQNQISKLAAEELIGSYSVKILEHYNITPSGVKHYELLTKENVSSIPTREFNWPYLAIRYKVETFVKQHLITINKDTDDKPIHTEPTLR